MNATKFAADTSALMVTAMPHHPVALVALVAEDEPLLRMQAVDMLTDAGFEVVEAANAANALAQFEAHQGIDLLFTDVRMPGRMDGVDLAHEVSRRWPATEIIVCSAVLAIYRAALPDKAMVFDKPYQTEKVTAAIQWVKNRPTDRRADV